jgi:D-alanine-D-alanine ligase
MGSKVAVIWADHAQGCPAPAYESISSNAPGNPPSDQAARVRDALGEAGYEAVCLRADGTLARRLREERPDAALPLIQGELALRADVQSLLELLQVPFVGTPSRMTTLATDKANLPAALAIASQSGPVSAVCPFTLCLGSRSIDSLGVTDCIDVIEKRIPGGYPMCVKPARTALGAGVTRVDSSEELVAALQAASRADGRVLVQEWIEGTLISVIVAGDGSDVGVLPPVEIVRETPDALGGTSSPDQPGSKAIAPVPADHLSADPEDGLFARSQIERDALDSFLACGMRDIARIDLIWDGSRSCILEVDPSPSFAQGSILDMGCAAAGMSLSELAGELAASAIERG